MKKYLKNIFPSIATTLCLLILPAVLSAYFIFSKYSISFAAQQGDTFYQDQSAWLSNFLLSQQWVDWINRFMDFAFWGALAIVVLMLVWAFSSSRTAIENHTLQEGFTNFQIDKKSWTRHFAFVAVLKVLLCALALYCVVALIATAIPQLSGAVSQVIYDTGSDTILACFGVAFYIFGLQYVMVTAIKTFRHLSTD